MIYLAFVLIIFALVALAAWQLQHFGLREKEWAAERSRLLSRIQHPEIVPVIDTELPPRAEHEYISSPATDDIDLVGTVQDYGPTD